MAGSSDSHRWTFLICLLGADESYAGSGETGGGAKVSSTAVQRTTEKTGDRIPLEVDRPRQPCSLNRDDEPADHGQPGRDSAGADLLQGQPGGEKHADDKVTVGRATGHASLRMRMRFLELDGHTGNCSKPRHFSGAIPILDYYHAAEHPLLTAICCLPRCALRWRHDAAGRAAQGHRQRQSVTQLRNHGSTATAPLAGRSAAASRSAGLVSPARLTGSRMLPYTGDRPASSTEIEK